MDDEFLCRYLDGDTSEAENQLVKDWIERDSLKHIARLNKLRFACAAFEHYISPTTSSQRVTCGWSMRRLSRFSACVAASIALLFGVWQLSNKYAYREMSSRIARIEAPAGQQVKIQLEDGTDVWLNAGTVLEYPPVFGRNIRRVKLSGEAMFEVQHDSRRPFVVETFTSEIEVLGTKFNVQADEKNNRFRTTLIEGSVKVTNLLNPSEVIMMEPFDEVELVDQRLSKSKRKDLNELCWTEGLIYIKEMPFNDLMDYFEKVYNVKIVISRNSLPEIKLQSGKIRISDGVDYALQVLQQVSNFTYRYDDDKNLIEIR